MTRDVGSSVVSDIGEDIVLVESSSDVGSSVVMMLEVDSSVVKTGLVDGSENLGSNTLYIVDGSKNLGSNTYYIYFEIGGEA